MMTKQQSTLKIPDQTDDIVCGCVNLTLGQLRAYAKDGRSYQQLLDETGAGSKCTTCLLDLEYYFERGPGEAPGTPTSNPTNSERRSIKRAVYDFIDRLSPPVPFTRLQRGPVLLRKGVEQWLVVANQKLLFADQFSPPPARISVQTFAGDGRALGTEHANVDTGTTARINLSAMFPEEHKDDLTTGSFEMTCRWLGAGVRGTIRPQIVLGAAGGCGAVHTQGASAHQHHWITCNHRPDDERVFISVVNVSAQAAPINIAYPHSIENVEALSHNFVIPPRGTWLHEITLADPLASRLGTQPFDVEIACNALKNLHIVCTDPSIQQISIDHI
jgi:bacterioferritin-associated ferredoxin